MNDPRVIAAIITLIGVIISIAISFFINYRSHKLDEKELYKSIERDYALELLKKRLEYYPKLNFELSSFHKEIHLKNELSRDLILSFFDKTNNLNSTYSIFFSTETVAEYYKLWTCLIKLLSNTQEGELISKQSGLNDLKKYMQCVEIALKKDIGVFIVDFQDGERSKKLEQSYKGIQKQLKDT
ncbi:hypothetical protein [Aquimarina litoralis]|uniref:hypothetical protein n=1 Tax=Aquimarina litoralis TaxID=584605 RepID=UPI001C5753AB|nr:hypothetical protein [Aquimarina litoralis]MBW1298591.1 hypothetical protein [Aquimarina litoralis]